MVHPSLKPVDRTILNHPVEKRGFVTVPFDYENPSAGTIDIFYRLIPTYDSHAEDSSKPIIVVFNGGPGIASSFYRPLNFDYQNIDAPQNGPVNRFLYLLKTHRVLIADQRGTAGHSAPINMMDPHLDPYWVAKNFSSDNQAHDYLAVIEHVIPKEVPFYIISQSYGGMVGMQYLSLKNVRKPNGILFTCSAVPYEDPIPGSIERRKEQLALNKQLKIAVPDIEDRLNAFKKRLQSLQLDPGYVNTLFTWLGKGLKGQWEQKLIQHLEKLMTSDRETLEKEFEENTGDSHYLNYILSAANFTPGFTDRTLAMKTSDEVPFEPWMIDENWILLRTGQDGGPTSQWVKRLDEHPPAVTPFASVETLRSAIQQNKVMFLAAENDAFVPETSYRQAVQKFQTDGKPVVTLAPGGHNAIFLKDGYDLFLKWSKE